MALGLAALVVAVVVRVGGDAVARVGADRASRPNILVLETDDQTVEDLRVMASTRRLLGEEGTTFENSFVSYPLCCPSRATLLTGRYAHNHGVLDNKPPAGGYAKLDGSSTLAVWLRRAGYHTALLGKYLNGYGARNPTEIPPGWSEWHATVDPSTYDYYDYRFNENGRIVPSAGRDPGSYLTDVESAKAQEIVGRLAPSAQPFFLWVAFLAPHAGGPREPGDPPGLGTPVAAPRHEGRFGDEPLPLTPSFDEADVSDKPAGIRNRPRLGPRRVQAITASYRQRLESLLAVDEAVAAIVARLRSTGELERTLIVFTSDNGFFHGEHRVATGKVLLYEPSIRVPLILRGPGVPRDRRTAEPVVNVDLAPTILDAASVQPGRVVDGVSLLGLLRDPGRGLARDVLLENGPGAGRYAAIRTPRYLYAEYAGGERELYDLLRDPDELESRHADPRYAAAERELGRRLATLRSCAGAACRRGPRVSLDLRFAPGSGGCARSAVRAGLVGADVPLAVRMEVSVAGRRVSTDTTRPLVGTVQPIELAGETARPLRARVIFSDGRVLTLDRRLRAC